jgi:hypothetical protein
VAEKERDEHFNTIRSMFLMKQEWRLKEKADIPAPMISDDDMDLLDDYESPLIKDGSPPPIGMDINIVFMLSAEFSGVEEEVTQMCLSPLGGHVREAQGVEPTHEVIIRTRLHRWKANLYDAHRWRRCHQFDVVLHFQESWMGGQRAYEDQPDF